MLPGAQSRNLGNDFFSIFEYSYPHLSERRWMLNVRTANAKSLLSEEVYNPIITFIWHLGTVRFIRANLQSRLRVVALSVTFV